MFPTGSLTKICYCCSFLPEMTGFKKCSVVFVLKDFIYLFLEAAYGREKGRERDIDV